MSSELLKNLAQTVINGDQALCSEITQKLLDDGIAPKTILDEGLVAGMEVVGREFREKRIFLPQVLISARAMTASLQILEPHLTAEQVRQRGVFVIGTVKGDLHDIGKNIVSIMLRGAGFRVVDLGINVSADTFIEAVRREQAHIVGMSALLTTTMSNMKTVIEKIRQEGLEVKTMIGGAPVSRAFAESVGADAYARNATEAVELSRAMLDGQIQKFG